MAGDLIAKWLAYIDKFVLFARLRAIENCACVGPYLRPLECNVCTQIHGVPVVSTCQRSARRSGARANNGLSSQLHWKAASALIISGLEESCGHMLCSQATLEDARRLVTLRNGRPGWK